MLSGRDGSIVRLSDVARVELGAEDAQLIPKYNKDAAVYLGVWPLPGANEIEVGDRLVVARVEAQWSVAEITKRFEMPTTDGARMAVGRALKRLTTKLHGKKES